MKIHLILLDNDRSQILENNYRELLTCIDCQACVKGCPGSRFFADGTRLSPRQYIYSFITGRNSSLDLCLQCKTCEANCPLDIDLPGMILDAKAEFTSRTRRSLTNTLIANAETLQSTGSSIAWLANAILSNRVLRWLAENILDISRERQLPVISRRTFARWFTSRVTKD